MGPYVAGTIFSVLAAMMYSYFLFHARKHREHPQRSSGWAWWGLAGSVLMFLDHYRHHAYFTGDLRLLGFSLILCSCVLALRASRKGSV